MNFLIYIAAFLLPLDNFPIMFGGAYKPVSLVFIALFFAVNFHHVLRMKYKKAEICIGMIVIGAIIVTAFQNISLHYSFLGLKDAASSLAAGLVIYLSFKIFVRQNEGRESYVKLFKWMLRGYGIALAVGLLQIVYMYVSSSGVLSSFIGLFIERKAYIQAHRLQFTFSEPSYIGLHTNLLIFPAYLVLKHTNNLSRYDRLIVLLFIPMSILSLSIRYFIDLVILYLVYTFVTSRSKEFVNLCLKLGAAVGIGLLLIHVVLVNNVFNLDSSHYYRILHIYNDPDKLMKDDSFSIRATYSKIGLHAFLDKPILGYGVGNYHYAYINHLDKIPPKDFKDGSELSDATNQLSLPQYNMYTRLLSEFGLMGIALFLLCGFLLLSAKGRNFSTMIILLLVFALLQFDSFAFIQLVFWIALLQSKFISELVILKLPGSAVAARQEAGRSRLVRPNVGPPLRTTTILGEKL